MQPVLRSLASTLIIAGTVATVSLGTATPLRIVCAALLPALVYTALLAWIARRLDCQVQVLVATCLGGAVLAAFLSATANELLQGWLTASLGARQGRDITAGFGAPVIEEASKALALFAVLAYRRGRFTSAVDGILHGACVGIGFAMTENAGYFTLAAVQGGAPGLGRSLYLRGLVQGLNHATFTGAVGAGLGVASVSASWWTATGAAVTGLVAAVLQHVGWNVVASHAVMDALCGAQVAGGACRSVPTPFALFFAVPLIVLVAIGPGVATLLVIAVHTWRRRRH